MSLGKIEHAENTVIGPTSWIQTRLGPAWKDEWSKYNILYEEFQYVPALTNGWVLDESDATADITFDSAVEGGKVNIQVDTTDNIEAWMQYGCPLIKASLGRKFIFEMGISMLLVGDNEGAIVCGLGDLQAAGDDVWQADNTAALSDVDFIGFQTLQADGDALNAVQRLNGTALATKVAGIHTPVISTVMKLGMYGDGANVHFAVDGVENATKAAYGSTSFPLDQLLSPVLATKLGSAVTQNVKAVYCLCAGDRV